MFLKKKLSQRDIDDLKENSKHLQAFVNNMHAALRQIKEKKQLIDSQNELINGFYKDEVGRLSFFINDRLNSTLKKSNKLLRKYNIKEINIQDDDDVIQDEETPEFFLLRYYLTLEDLKSPLKHLKIAPIKGFDFFKTLNYFRITSIGEKIQLLSYYYVSDDSEKNNLNIMFENDTKRNTLIKIEHIHNDYALYKITRKSTHSDGSQAGPYDFNFDHSNFKEVLNRIKNNTNNVVNLR